MDATSSPISHTYVASHVWTFKKILEGPNAKVNWGLKRSKTLNLTLDGYQDIVKY